MPTPYAILMVRPADDDAAIRRAFHAISKSCHPDKLPTTLTEEERAAAQSRWFRAAAAYSCVKTPELRDKQVKYMRGLAGCCKACSGSGVRGTRAAGGQLRLCAACAGEGRVKGGAR